MAKWYYLIDGQQSGPIDPAELKRLATLIDFSPIMNDDRIFAVSRIKKLIFWLGVVS